jgi:predicted lipoprotein with Yx(FWY)xxD motif
MIRWLLPLTVLVAVAAGGATAALGSSAATVKTVDNAKFGTVLVGSTGRTLYRFSEDSKGVNRCTGDPTCAKYWPQLLVKATVKPVAGTGVKASLLGTIKAAHGMRQVTYAGFPLYTFAGDTKAGQANGQGFEKEWYVVNTKGALVKHSINGGPATGSTPPPSQDPGYGYGTTTTP